MTALEAVIAISSFNRKIYEADQAGLAGSAARASLNTPTGKLESRKLGTFLEVGQTLAGTCALKEAMTRVLEMLGQHHSMMRGVVMLLDTTERVIGYKVKKYGIECDCFRT